jgi:hypothetical protein
VKQLEQNVITGHDKSQESCLRIMMKSFVQSHLLTLTFIKHQSMGVADFFTNVWYRLKLPTRFTRDLLIGIAVGITFSLSSTSLALLAQGWRRKRAVQRIPPRPIELRSDEVVPGVIGLIGELYAFRQA